MSEPEVQERKYFEDILPRTGWGLYYKFMVVIACAACFSQAVVFFALPFSIALSTCEHQITKGIILNLHLSFILGQTFGGLLLNIGCDIYGRKKLITNTMLLVFLNCFVAAFAINYYVMILSAFLLASGLETNYCVVRVHLAEILPINRRGVYLSICDLSWCFGYTLVSLLGVLLKTPSDIESNAAEMKLAYWKMMLGIAGGLHLTIACVTALLEESPRYYLHIKKYYLAVLILKQFYAINKSTYGEYLEVKEADVTDITDKENPSIYPESRNFMNTLTKLIKTILVTVKKVFSKKYLRTTILLLLIKLPLLIFGHLNVNIMVAKLSSADTFVQEGIEVLHLESLKNFTLCNPSEQRETLYYIYFALVVGIFIGISTVLCFVEYLGRKILMCITLVLCGACYIAFFWVKNTAGKIILSSVLMTSFSAAITTVSVINIESYPTALRCTSWGILNLPGLLLSHIIIRCYHLLANYFLISLASLFFGATLAAYFLHDLKRKPMVE